MEEDLTSMQQTRKWEVCTSSETKKRSKRPPRLACLCCNLCEFVSRLRREGVWLQCVLVWGRRERGREGGREEKTTRRVYHQVRVRRERQAERLVWASVRETRKTAVLWTAVKIIWSLPWIRNTCLNLTDLYSISCELSQRPLKVPRCFRNILGFKPASIVQKCVL